MQQRIDARELDLKTRLGSVNRVAKTVKGGRNMRFSALVVVGDENGHVGCGQGKAVEIPEAIRKAEESAKRNMITVSRDGSTIPHRIIGKFSKSSIVMMPATAGTGVIASNHARAVLELAGIEDVNAKTYGSRNAINVVKATLAGLAMLKTKAQIERLRGVTIE